MDCIVELLNEMTAEIVENNDPPFSPLVVKNGPANAKHRIIGLFNFSMFNVEVQGRDEYLLAVELEGVCEVITLGFVLERMGRNQAVKTKVVIDPHLLHALIVDEANLVIITFGP